MLVSGGVIAPDEAGQMPEKAALHPIWKRSLHHNERGTTPMRYEQKVQRAAHRISAGALVADVAVHVRIDEVLTGALKAQHRLPEPLERTRFRHAHERRRSHAVIPPGPSEGERLVDGRPSHGRLSDWEHVQERTVPGPAGAPIDWAVAAVTASWGV